ncbi:LysR family transcriptional regulator [Pelomonas sp. UHG3]|uniref:LysR family transcriptional regulator n=2 Tax=Roseateles hydrophilus TaxID=2975054 RepID=A0ACC6CEN7_9BURK|nr:LysR family transcriptional regulator [Pelomonas sp. UHG3]
MRHDLLTLELLLAIAQTRSITRGAEQVHLALAAASKRVSDLEARLGVRLFVRPALGVDPTPACRSLLTHVRTVTEGGFNRSTQHTRGHPGRRSVEHEATTAHLLLG